MEVPGWFFNRLATIQAVRHPQGPAGGEIPAPSTVAVQVPCCVQQDGSPDPKDLQGRRSSVASVRIFFRPRDGTSIDAVRALKRDDKLNVTGWANPMVLEGPPFDASGRGVVWEAAARNGR